MPWWSGICSMAQDNPSGWAARDGSPPMRNGCPGSSPTAAAPTVALRPTSARCITWPNGNTAGPPTSTTSNSSATPTTASFIEERAPTEDAGERGRTNEDTHPTPLEEGGPARSHAHPPSNLDTVIDLRSDTVTRPSAGMKQAMTDAPVGDDVFNDDPTVHRLEAMVAERLGKEAAVYVTSGTQSNLVGLLAHCGRGDEYIVGDMAHCYRWEGGGAAVLGSIQPQPIPMRMISIG